MNKLVAIMALGQGSASVTAMHGVTAVRTAFRTSGLGEIIPPMEQATTTIHGVRKAHLSPQNRTMIHKIDGVGGTGESHRMGS